MRLVDAPKAMDSQLVIRAENMAITSSFVGLGVVLNAPTSKRVGLEFHCLSGIDGFT